MANRKISDLTALTAPVTGDLLPIVDISEATAADKNKKITYGTFLSSVPLGTAAAPSIAFTGDTNTGIYSPGADQLAISTAGSGRLFVDASGRIGMGAAEGTYAASLTTTGNNGFIVKTGTSSAVQIYAGNTAGESALGTLTNDPLNIITNGSSRIRITSAGLVGIGTSSPSKLLNLAANDGNAAILLARSNSGAASLGQVGFSTVNGTVAGIDATGVTDSNNGTLRFWTTGGSPQSDVTSLNSSTPRMVITSAGNVGIGVTSPSSLLHLADAGHITVGTTTGTKIGTATTQKLGFYNATPVVQPTAVADATTAVDVITQLNALLAKLRTLGIIAT